MCYGQNRGKLIRKLSKSTLILREKDGNLYMLRKYGENIYFLEKGNNAICIIDLVGMGASAGGVARVNTLVHCAFCLVTLYKFVAYLGGIRATIFYILSSLVNDSCCSCDLD